MTHTQFTPHFLPEGKSFLREVPVMEKPEEWMDGYGNKMERYNEHLAALPSYPATWLTPDMKDVMVLGRDFKLSCSKDIEYCTNECDKTCASCENGIAVPIPAQTIETFYCKEYNDNGYTCEDGQCDKCKKAVALTPEELSVQVDKESEETDLQIAWKLSQGRNKPHFVDTFRTLLNQYDKEEISMSKFVECLNVEAYKWAKTNGAEF